MSETVPLQAPEGSIPPLHGAAREIWRDTASAISALYDNFLIVMAINVAGDLIAFSLVRGWPDDSVRALLVTVFIGAVQAYFITPFIIAVHRYVVLGEVAPSYLTNFGGERFMRFFGWTLGLTFCFTLPVVIVGALPFGEGMRAFLLLFVSIVAIIFGLRLSIMFPSIAVDAPGAKFANVMADTKGHAWRILLLGFVVMLPFIGVIVLFAIIFAIISGFAERETVLSTVVGSILETFLLTMFVVMASRLFGWLGNHVRHS